jgi:hypothetical protein
MAQLLRFYRSPHVSGRHGEWFGAVYLAYVTVVGWLAWSVLPRTPVTAPLCLIAYALPWNVRHRGEPKTKPAYAAAMMRIGSVWLVVLAVR